MNNTLHKLRIIQNKWIFHVFFVLWATERANFNKIKRSIKPITSRILSKRLQDLVEFGFVIKEVILEKPKRVEYSLSEKGKNFFEAMVSFFRETKLVK